LAWRSRLNPSHVGVPHVLGEEVARYSYSVHRWGRLFRITSMTFFLNKGTHQAHLIALPFYSLFMLSLFVVELSSFIASTTHSTVVVDFNRDQQVRIAAGRMGRGVKYVISSHLVGPAPRSGSVIPCLIPSYCPNPVDSYQL
jgi:hypothetical protein